MRIISDKDYCYEYKSGKMFSNHPLVGMGGRSKSSLVNELVDIVSSRTYQAGKCTANTLKRVESLLILVGKVERLKNGL